MSLRLMAAGAVSALAMVGSASAVPVQITVSNVNPIGGFSFTTVYFGFSNDSFNAFDLDQAASNGIEVLAETGVFGPLAGERVAAVGDGSSQGAIVGTENGMPNPLTPGETQSIVVDLDPSNQFVQFASMLLPSNDTFFGTADAIQLFDDAGNILSPFTLNITASDLFDAGTEVNDFANGPAFVDGQSVGDGADEGGVITDGVTFDSLGLGDVSGDLLLATGDVLSLVLAEQFFENNAVLANITFELVDTAEVPVPAAALLFAPVVGGLALARRRRKQQA